MAEQKHASEALIAFCRERKVNYPKEIELCLKSLNENNPHAAFEHYKTVRLEGMGSLTDAWPLSLSGENPNYSSTILSALSAYWHSWMKLLGEKL